MSDTNTITGWARVSVDLMLPATLMSPVTNVRLYKTRADAEAALEGGEWVEHITIRFPSGGAERPSDREGIDGNN